MTQGVSRDPRLRRGQPGFVDRGYTPSSDFSEMHVDSWRPNYAPSSASNYAARYLPDRNTPSPSECTPSHGWNDPPGYDPKNTFRRSYSPTTLHEVDCQTASGANHTRWDQPGSQYGSGYVPDRIEEPPAYGSRGGGFRFNPDHRDERFSVPGRTECQGTDSGTYVLPQRRNGTGIGRRDGSADMDYDNSSSSRRRRDTSATSSSSYVPPRHRRFPTPPPLPPFPPTCPPNGQAARAFSTSHQADYYGNSGSGRGDYDKGHRYSRNNGQSTYDRRYGPWPPSPQRDRRSTPSGGSSPIFSGDTFRLELPREEYVRWSCEPIRESNHPVTKLLVLDLNGALVYRTSRTGPNRVAYPRPFLDDFLEYVLGSDADGSGFNVLVWSSAQPHNVENMVRSTFDRRFYDGVFAKESPKAKKRAAEQGRLLDVWARDKMNLPAAAYGRKVQTVKDLRKVTETFTDFDERTTVLLDDSPLKAMHQPWSQIIIPEYDRPEFQDAKDAVSKMVNGQQQGHQPAPDGSNEPRVDNILLGVIGILEAMRHVANIPAWVRAGHINTPGNITTPTSAITFNDLPSHESFVPWFKNEATHAYWVQAGRDALARRGITVSHGLRPDGGRQISSTGDIATSSMPQEPVDLGSAAAAAADRTDAEIEAEIEAEIARISSMIPSNDTEKNAEYEARVATAAAHAIDQQNSPNLKPRKAKAKAKHAARSPSVTDEERDDLPPSRNFSRRASPEPRSQSPIGVDDSSPVVRAYSPSVPVDAAPDLSVGELPGRGAEMPKVDEEDLNAAIAADELDASPPYRPRPVTEEQRGDLSSSPNTHRAPPSGTRPESPIQVQDSSSSASVRTYSPSGPAH